MICPKCKAENTDNATECEKCAVVFVHIRNGRNRDPSTVSQQCPWNDHGVICGLIGSLSNTTLGQGPWYCATHYWMLMGWPRHTDERTTQSPAPCAYPGCINEGVAGKNPFYCMPHYGAQLPGKTSYRERWYAEHGLTYEPPKIGNTATHTREPGDDDELVTQA